MSRCRRVIASRRTCSSRIRRSSVRAAVTSSRTSREHRGRRSDRRETDPEPPDCRPPRSPRHRQTEIVKPPPRRDLDSLSFQSSRRSRRKSLSRRRSPKRARRLHVRGRRPSGEDAAEPAAAEELIPTSRASSAAKTISAKTRKMRRAAGRISCSWVPRLGLRSVDPKPIEPSHAGREAAR